MAVNESIPVTGQQAEPPTREERDRAYSSGAGRKAEERPTHFAPQHKKRVREQQKKSEDIESEVPTSAPIGLAMETTAESIDEDAPGHGG